MQNNTSLPSTSPSRPPPTSPPPNSPPPNSPHPNSFATQSNITASTNNLVDIILEVLAQSVNNNNTSASAYQNNAPLTSELYTDQNVDVPGTGGPVDALVTANLDTAGPGVAPVVGENGGPVYAPALKQETLDNNMNNFVDTIIEILTKQGNNPPKQEKEDDVLGVDDIKITDGSVDDLVNLIIGVLSNSSNVSPPQTRLQNFKNATSRATSSAVDVAKSLGKVASNATSSAVDATSRGTSYAAKALVKTGNTVKKVASNTTSSILGATSTLSNSAMKKLRPILERITNDEPVSKNTKFVSILNKAMRKVDSKCDLIILIHSIETLLKNDAKSEDKLSDPDRRFYENILPILKTKVTEQTINNKPNKLSVTLSEIDNNIIGAPIVNDTENTIRNLFIQDDDNNNNNNGLTFWSQMIGPTFDGRRLS